jgi:hypothetical protein
MATPGVYDAQLRLGDGLRRIQAAADLRRAAVMMTPGRRLNETQLKRSQQEFLNFRQPKEIQPGAS